MKQCIICDRETDQTVTGTIGGKHGVMCEDCQYWCDGNLIDPPNPEIAARRERD